ncbi:molybdopterin-dependent oxidoreductase [Anaerospora sp.]|uniref:molybdopterin-dependent oxidoreductase n=1 Tax=Anaerospora sp. TaxID=1960278 RepID=UPI0028991E4D|nr:molybdopterin-dependent oxidoreductase [Anaerospora sp.]
MNGLTGKLHTYHAVIALLLALTGLVLHSQLFREEFAFLRTYLNSLHVVIGLFFMLTVVVYVRAIANARESLAGNIRLQGITVGWLVISVVLSFTGLLLFFAIDLYNLAGVGTLTLHRWAAVFGISSGLYHIATSLYSQQHCSTADKTAVTNGHSLQTSRRSFIRWSAAVGALVGGGGLTKWLFGLSTNTDWSETNKKYKDCNKMVPQPSPSLGSLPPVGGGYKGNFEVFTVTPIPCADSDTWKFTLSGLVDNPMSTTWKGFLDLPRVVQVSNFHCITGWSVYNVTYEGIALAQLLNLAGVQAAAKYVKFYSGDGVYTSALSLDQAQSSDVMIAVLMDGQPIPSDLGGPARLLVPQMYAYKGVKWLNAIELISEPHIGFWESRGYENDAWVRGLKK